MVDNFRSESNKGHSQLPKPNVIAPMSDLLMQEHTPESIKGILINPIYTGVGPFPPLVKDEVWVSACAKLIEEEGSEQFLVNLLFVLRECFPIAMEEE
jgi:hypothetical protein